MVQKTRKDKKVAKKNLKAGRKPPKTKDPGIPNSWPFKEQLLQEVEEQRNAALEAKQKQQECQLNKSLNLKSKKNIGALGMNMEEIAKRAMANQEVHNTTTLGKELAKPTSDISARVTGEQNRRSYLKDLKSVVSQSDVVLQILDARDPQSFRAGLVENVILSNPNKKLVLVLNKVDLAPSNDVASWLTHLRRSHPTIAIKAGTGSDGAKGRVNTKSSSAKFQTESSIKTTKAVGIDSLVELLKNYSRRISGGKSSITVGVIGYPNVGKSSIINSLLRGRKSVGVSSKPGYTTCIQEVILDKGVTLLDSPGVVFDDKTDDVLLRNCVDVDAVTDPIPAITELLKKCNDQSLMRIYSIPSFNNDVNKFLAMIGKQTRIDVFS